MKNIKVIIWDVDGTLYQDVPQLEKAIGEDLLQRIERKLVVDGKQASELFKKNYQKLGSSTRVLLQLGFDWQEVRARSRTCQLLKKKFLKKDVKLIAMFAKLKTYRHLVASNNFADIIVELLAFMGLKPEIFEKIFGISPAIIKPQLVFFQRILDYTGLPADQHLFVGDREETEILPAKKLGMKTCFVGKRRTTADVSLKKIYDIVKIL